ncbi:MAG: YaeQ family protein [Burkholderiales bacterium]
MALKSTIYKAALQVADMDRHYYADHALTIACHPSETAERMMVRVLAFALNAGESLAFGRGLSDVAEPDLVEADLTGAIRHWIEVGQPDPRAVLKACGKASRVTVYPYSASAAKWWKDTGPELARARNLSVQAIDADTARELAGMAERSMDLQCTIQDGEVWLRSANAQVQVELAAWRT